MASGAQIRLSLRVYHLLATLALPKNMALVLGSACFGWISTFGGEVGLHASFGFVAFIHGFFQFQTSSTTIGKALDKIRFEGLTDKSKLDAQPELLIRLVPDKANKTLLIVDSGVGMTKADYWLVSQTCDGCYCSWSKLQMKAIGDYGFGDTFM